MRFIGKQDERSMAELLEAIQDSRYDVHTPAMLALLRVRNPAAVPELIGALSIPHRVLRAVVATMLGEIGDQRAVEPLIALLNEGLSDTDGLANERASAAIALGRLGDPLAIDSLIAALSDPNGWTQSRVVEALGRLDARRAFEPLIAIMRTRHDPSIATILGNRRDRRAVAPLLEELEAQRQSLSHGRSDVYAYYIIRALGKLGDSRANSLLEWFRDHEQEPVLKGKSLADMAEKALQRIAQQASEE